MNKIQVIVFDLDGVVFDSVQLMHAYTRTTYPGITDSELLDFHKGNIVEKSRNFTLAKRVETEEEKSVRDQEYTAQKSNSLLYPGINELLHDLAQKYTLAISTSALDENCIPILEKHGIKDLFSFIGTRSVHVSKVEKFKMICEKFQVGRDQVIFVTDTVGDVIEAYEANIKTIVVTWGIHSKSDFELESFPNIIGFVDSTNELKSMLNSL